MYYDIPQLAAFLKVILLISFRDDQRFFGRRVWGLGFRLYDLAGFRGVGLRVLC